MEETLSGVTKMLEIIHSMPDRQHRLSIAEGLNYIHDLLHKMETLLEIDIKNLKQKQN